MINTASRFDAPFWGLLLASVLVVASVGFFGLAVAAQHEVRTDASIVAPFSR